MRNEKEILENILSIASRDSRIRAVILNGSRTNKHVPKDEFQDFDVIYLVEEITSFEAAPDWIDVFGERIILQMPNSMDLGENAPQTNQNEIVYLMLFKDFNRIDLRLVDVQNRANCQDSLNKVLLDKDDLFDLTIQPSDRDYWVKRPSPKVFFDCCNEFWWVTPYVVKGLARGDILYAKDMLEGPIRKMFMTMLAWYVASENGFSINLGASNRFLKNHVNSSMWKRILTTYPNAQKTNIWNSLMEMTDIFHELAIQTAGNILLDYNIEEAENVKGYLKTMENKIVG